ncbi:hypothetical protein VKI21_05980 [Cyanobacterium aponinum UTEX 3222]|uniref:type IV pilus modification PilV family protein n=1 Tax=Cyanobacterium aponinum TaxID=379064 RepID=UPI00308A0945|nr:hypothetical protein VKI21_05980 [Cyanobacterium aponinum UTEX 3222]
MSNLFTFILLKNLKNIYSHKLSQDPTFCLKNGKWEEGFSILEVLVTILVITGFVLGSLQATVLATLLRVQAQDKQEATNWVQQDLELIRYQAFILDSSGVNTATCTASTYGARLRDNSLDPDIDNNGFDAYQGVRINDKWYRVFREYTPVNNILRVNYTVAYSPVVSGVNTVTHPRYKSSASYNATSTTPPPSTNPNVVTTLSTEVLPNAALSCS